MTAGISALASPAQASAQTSPLPTYVVKTSYGGSGPCSGTRTTSVPVGVPVPVDAGGTPAPDLLVQLSALPPPLGNGVVELDITRLTVEPVRLAVTASAGGVTFGYDGCASTAPRRSRPRQRRRRRACGCR